MATVRMSDRLSYAIRSEAERQFDNVHKEEEIPMSIGDSIYKENVEPFVKEAKSLVKKYNFKKALKLDEFSSINIAIVSDVSGETTNHVEAPMSATRFCPTGGYGETATVKLSNISENGKAITKILYANEDISNKKQEYKSKVSDAIENFTTLNQALKAWPAIKKLIPEEEKWALQRVYEKVQRKKKSDEQRAEIELNEAELNSVILTNSLLGDNE